MNGGRLIVAVLGVVIVVASATGVPLLPYRWVGVSTETMIGWAMVLAVPALIVVLLLVVLDRLRQVKRHLAANTRMLMDQQGRGKVIRGPWRKSG